MIANGRISWFNPAKRFGFVKLADGGGDAFLHFDVLKAGGYYAVPRGTSVKTRVESDPAGRLRVLELLAVDLTTALPGEAPASPRVAKSQ